MIYCFDTETHRIAAANLAPKIVCVQMSEYGKPSTAEIFTTDSEAVDLIHICDIALIETIITQRGAYDLACICSNFPDLIPAVFKALDDGRVHDVSIREKLLMLAQHGYVDNRPTETGSERLTYNLAAIVDRRLGLDISASKEADSWRLNYDVLEGLPVAEWPEDAVEYALDDVRLLDAVFTDQAEEASRIDFDVFKTERLHVAADFCLYLLSCRGIAVDPVERQRIADWIAEELSPEALAPLFECGILRKEIPSQPHKNQMKKAYQLAAEAYSTESCPMTAELVADDVGFWDHLDPAVEHILKEGGIRFTQPKKSTKDMKQLRAIISEVCAAHEIPLQYTDKGGIATSKEFVDNFDHLDPRMGAYAHRAKFEKILSTEIPRMQGERVHCNYDVLKETGRTSSWGSDLYPSINGQNVDPQVRGAFVPDPGWVICSVDYSTIELCCFAQKQLDLFGRSTMADLLNKGVDLHAYLGAQMAYEIGLEEFNNALDSSGLAQKPNGQPVDNYDCFLSLKHGDEAGREFYAHWRKFAKPVGLGYPGGLGADTFITFAKGSYGVIVSRDEAVQFKSLWLRTFPEAEEYFAWINQDCELPNDGGYWYESPMGMLRTGASYCAAANGAALQTPAAEGAKLGIWLVTKACFDPTEESILYGCQPWNFVHDELLVNIPHDELMHERAWEISRLWVQGMEHVITKVPVRAEPALMDRWNKYAEYVTDENGRIAIWQPKQDQ